jgi:hypothetical protein
MFLYCLLMAYTYVICMFADETLWKFIGNIKFANDKERKRERVIWMEILPILFHNFSHHTQLFFYRKMWREKSSHIVGKNISFGRSLNNKKKMWTIELVWRERRRARAKESEGLKEAYLLDLALLLQRWKKLLLLLYLCFEVPHDNDNNDDDGEHWWWL